MEVRAEPVHVALGIIRGLQTLFSQSHVSAITFDTCLLFEGASPSLSVYIHLSYLCMCLVRENHALLCCSSERNHDTLGCSDGSVAWRQKLLTVGHFPPKPQVSTDQ